MDAMLFLITILQLVVHSIGRTQQIVWLVIRIRLYITDNGYSDSTLHNNDSRLTGQDRLFVIGSPQESVNVETKWAIVGKNLLLTNDICAFTRDFFSSLFCPGGKVIN